MEKRKRRYHINCVVVVCGDASVVAQNHGAYKRTDTVVLNGVAERSRASRVSQLHLCKSELPFLVILLP